MKTIFRPYTLYINSRLEYKRNDDKLLIKEECRFFQGQMGFCQDVGYCSKTNRYFILNIDKNNLKLFCDYKVVDIATGNKVDCGASTNWKESKNSYGGYMIWKNRGSREWYYAHPYQGGMCSGR